MRLRPSISTAAERTVRPDNDCSTRSCALSVRLPFARGGNEPCVGRGELLVGEKVGEARAPVQAGARLNIHD